MDSIIPIEAAPEDGFVMATCRTCKSRSDQMQSVFEVIDNCIISEMIMACTSIQISDTDNLPKFICKVCIEQLRKAHSFKAQCEAVDASFRSYLDQCVKKENDVFPSQTDQNSVSMDCLLPSDNNVSDKSNEPNQPPLIPLDKNMDFVELHDDKVIFTCRECLKIYYSIESFRAHKHSAHLGYIYKCKDCDKTFNRSSGLRYHRQSHESRKTYVCRICKQSLSRLDHLKRHLLVHLKDKPFNCEQCQRGFTRQERLALHAPKCTGFKGYICDICNKCCLREAGLIEHRKLHVNAEPMMLTMQDLQNYVDYYDVFEENRDLPPLEPRSTADAEDSDSDDDDFPGPSDIETTSDICTEAISDTEAVNNTDVDISVKSEEENTIEELMVVKKIVKEKQSKLSSKIKKVPKKRKREPKKKLKIKVTKTKKRKATPPVDEPVEPSKEKNIGYKHYKCSECTIGFNNRRIFEKHLQQVHNKLLHKCEICEKEFCRADNFHRHMRFHYANEPADELVEEPVEPPKENNEKKEYKCPECAIVYTNRRIFEKHVKKVHSKLLHKCEICDREFSRADNFHRHMKFHSEPVEPSKENIEQKEYKCSECAKVFTNRRIFENHARDVHGKFMHKCNICGREFYRADNYNRHMKFHSSSRVKRFSCDVCEKKFGRSEHLTRHKKVHDKPKQTRASEKKFKCTVCAKAFTTEKYRDVHAKTHTAEKTFVCPTCSKCFLSKSHLKEHVKFHDDNCKTFLCSECGQRFVRNDFLMIHMRRHRGEKPYKCQYCSKGFARCWDLTVHERYHTGEKKHLCTVCGKGFTRAHSLTIHMRTHTGEKPYKCRHCDACFAQSNDLKAHTRRHTGERFQCELCTEKFLMGYLLTQHKRTVHGLNIVTNNKRLEMKLTKNPNESFPNK